MGNHDAKRFRGRLLALWICALVLAALAVFVIPWHVPSAHVALGESYSLGFNNRAAVIGFGLVICCLGVGMLFAARSDAISLNACQWFRNPQEIWPDSSDPETRADIVVLALACVAMTQYVLWWDSKLVIPYWGEADYFLSRIDLIALGSKPYVDFSFLYGPATLYVPFWLDRLSLGNLGLERAYAWTVVGSYVTGFVCNYFALRSLALPKGWRPGLLLLCCIMWLPLTMGLQYTPLRFMVVPCVLALLLGAGTPSWSRLRRDWATSGLAVGGTGVAFLLFPEMGVVCAAASLAFAVVLHLRGRPQLAAYITFGVAVMAFVVHLSFPGYFEGMRAFVKGAMNFPIYPNLHNLMLVGASLYVIATSGATVLLHIHDVRSPFVAAIAAASTLLLSPSLGRCDPGHVGFNSSMLFLTMFAALAARGRTWLLAWAGAFAFSMVVLNQISYWNHYLESFKQALVISEFYTANPEAVLAWQEAWEQRRKQQAVPASLNWHRTAPFPAWATHSVLADGASLPIGGDVGLDRFVKTQAGYRPPFHPPPKPDLYVPADITRAETDARRQRVLILPEHAYLAARDGFSVDPAAYETQTGHFLSGLMIFPVTCRLRNPPFFPDIELCKLLTTGGEVVATGAGYTVLRIPGR